MKSQNKDYISYERSYFNNKSLISASLDEFKSSFKFKNSRIIMKYSNLNVNMINNSSYYENEAFKNLYTIGLGIKKKIKINNVWNSELFFVPQWTTNYFDKLYFDNIVFNTNLSFIKVLNNQSSLKLSLEYGTLFGKPSFYPLIEYNGILSRNLKYTIGFPKMNFRYDLNMNNSIEIYSNFESYYTLLSPYYSNNLNEYVDNLNSFYQSRIESGFEYKYIFNNESILNLKIGKSFYNILEIEEQNSKVKYDFNNNFIIAMGIKYNLN